MAAADERDGRRFGFEHVAVEAFNVESTGEVRRRFCDPAFQTVSQRWRERTRSMPCGWAANSVTLIPPALASTAPTIASVERLR